MTTDEKLLSEVVQRILKVARPERIILFGSGVEGTMTRDSDIDLLVIEWGFRNEREESICLRSALIDLDVSIDVFAMALERFEETKNVIGGLAYPANKYGKVIYQAARRGESRGCPTDFGVTSVNYSFEELFARAQKPS